MTIEIAKRICDLLKEARAYYRAYELTGEEFCLNIAQDLEMDAARLEVN